MRSWRSTASGAPNFKAVVQPNSWRKGSVVSAPATGASKQRLAYQAYFAKLLEDLRPGCRTPHRPRRHNPNSGSPLPRGRPEQTSTGPSLVENRSSEWNFISTLETASGTRPFSNALHQDREAIEQSVGIPVNWDALVGKQGMRISASAPLNVSIESSSQDLQRVQAWAVDTMAMFVKVFRPRLKAIP